jgi:hypothetical protein
MGAPHMVMKHYDPMIGGDFHMVTIPPAGPVGPSPYFTMSLLNGLLIFFTPLNKQVTQYGITVAKGSDIGGGIAHVGPPSVDLAVTILTSGSKCHFGSASYQVMNKPPALALLVAANPNLNCGTPVPTGSGVVICLNTHMAGMSWADVLGGFGSMMGDAIVQTAFNALGTAFGGLKVFKGHDLAAAIAWAAITFGLGTPLGPGIANTNSIKDQKGDSWAPSSLLPGVIAAGELENVGRAVGDYLDGKPPHLPDPPDIRYPNLDPNKPTFVAPSPSNTDLL